jgi:hypothetical protein
MDAPAERMEALAGLTAAFAISRIAFAGRVAAVAALLEAIAALAMPTTAGAAVDRNATAAAPTAQQQLAISPEPGTPDASPRTQISILGVSAGMIKSVAAHGSSSGAHAGVLRSYSGNRGASFVPSTPFTQGERVAVVIRITGRRPVRFSFTVARLAPTPPILNIPKTQPDKLQHFASEPLLLPPRIEVLKGAGSLKSDVFLTPLPSPEVHPGSNNAITINPVGPGGPMIIDSRGRLLWFKQLAPPTVAANFRPQQYRGKTVLTWWQGQVTIAAYGLGEGVIADTSYRTIRTVHVGNGYSADIHEFKLTPDGDALFTVNSLVLLHLPGTRPGAQSLFLDSILQEVDIRTGLVVWEWHGLGHVPVADSYATTATSPYFDAYHFNSIQLLAGHRLLASARDTCAVYEIDRATGHILWTLGGKASSFRMGRGSRFYFQHDAKLYGTRVTLFDDQGGPPFYSSSSRGSILSLDMRRHTAKLLKQYLRPGHDTLADSEGSFQNLAGGAKFVGFGSEPFFSAFSSSGALTFDAKLPKDDGSYRAFTYSWDATPTTRPAVAAKRNTSGGTDVYASWAGATTVARWQVLAGSSAGSLKPIEVVAKRGFETHIGVHSSAAKFAVRALSAAGRILAQSPPVSPP